MFIKNYKIILFIILINFIFNIILLNFFFEKKRIAVLDIQSIINEYTINISKKNLSNEEEIIKNFIQDLNFLISKIAKDNNLIILPTQAVFDGADFDITEEVKLELYGK